MKRILIALLLTVSIVDGYALSDHSQISILTCGPGKNIYTCFGHTALRVKDKYKDIDIVFNYGTFTSSEDNFYQKFVNGTLMYFLSVSDFNRFYKEYAAEGREVVEQILNLSTYEKNIIWDKLCHDYSEENRHYKYDFIKNNCTTKIRDVLVLINPIYAYEEPATFRRLINDVIEDKKGLMFLLNVLMGNKADRLLEWDERNCLPDIFMNSLNRAQIISSETIVPLVIESRVILQDSVPVVFSKYNLVFFSIAMLVVIFNVFLLFNNYPLWIEYTKWMLSPILLFAGLLGLLISFLGVVNFQLAYPNINIFLCSPLNLLLLPLLFVRRTVFRDCLLFINLSGCFVYVILLLSEVQKAEFQSVIFLILLMIIYSLLLYGNFTRFVSGNRKYCALQCK